MIKEETLVLCLCPSAQVSTVQACRGGYKLTAAFDVVLKKKAKYFNWSSPPP